LLESKGQPIQGLFQLLFYLKIIMVETHRSVPLSRGNPTYCMPHTWFAEEKWLRMHQLAPRHSWLHQNQNMESPQLQGEWDYYKITAQTKQWLPIWNKDTANASLTLNGRGGFRCYIASNQPTDWPYPHNQGNYISGTVEDKRKEEGGAKQEEEGQEERVVVWWLHFHVDSMLWYHEIMICFPSQQRGR